MGPNEKHKDESEEEGTIQPNGGHADWSGVIYLFNFV